jgi:UDP-glucose 4-epimerase
MKKILITGGSGFFGDILKRELLKKGFFCVNIDLEKDEYSHDNLVSVQGDIRDAETVRALFEKHKFNAVFHCAAILAHAVKDSRFLWTSNVDGTRVIAEACRKYKVKKIVFTSSNCLWARNFHRGVREDDIPEPVEIYGKSKWEGEKILMEYARDLDAVIFRCPTIMDEGRLGLLGILFEFIEEGRKVWVVGGGDNTYQFIYARDLADAFLKALDYKSSDVFNIGSDNVKSFKEVYEYVIKKSGAKASSVPSEEADTLRDESRLFSKIVSSRPLPV